MIYDRTSLLLVLLSALGACLLYAKQRKNGLPFPPSLKGYPVIGNLLKMPSCEEFKVYRDVSRELNSDIISYTVFGQVIVVINSLRVAVDLLVKRGAIYSDRAELPMLNDESLVGWGKNTGFIRYGERWKHQRNMTQAALHPDAGEDLWPKMRKQIRLSMQRLLYRPEIVARELQWMTAAMILSSVYGYESSYPSDELVELVETSVLHLSEAGMPGKFYVNTIPWMKHIPDWFPGTGWKRQAKLWGLEAQRTINEPYEWTKSQMAAGVALPSILKNMLTTLTTNEPPKHGIAEQEDIIRWVAGTMYVAGADTTVSAMTTFILAMVLYPQFQKKAQAELDAVLGENKLPELSDRQALPYLNAVLKEVMRWRTVIPLGVPRTCTKDNEYNGFLIPKGAIVLGNIWAISNNPDVYSNPDDFDPDRFYNTDLPAAPAFGFGRRDCPGSHFAESSLFLMASTFLAVFEVTSTPGKPVPHAIPHSGLLVSHPAPFDCTVISRSEPRRRLIEQWIEA